MSSGSRYRQDIDGLRAIAILGVILYHAGFTRISGGYAGVDVFFVISGFLIGGIILDELADGSLSFRRFYARRIRRIYPALVTVVLATLVAGWFLMLPKAYQYAGGAAAMALLSLSNIWFLNVIDYFNPSAASDPLIHTWSLGVEEQFYLVAPLLLLGLWHRARRLMIPLLILLALASFATAILTAHGAPMAAFYLIHTRAWELLAGVLTACLTRRWTPPGILALLGYPAGLLLISAGLLFVPDLADWPGVWTLPAVIGSVLVLISGTVETQAGRILAFAPLRFIGLISYSLYLWHQPVFSYLKIAQLWPSDLAGILLVLAGLVALSALSWRFVEQPFRGSHALPKGRKAALVLASACVVALAIGGHVTKGYPVRISPDATAVLAYANSYAPSYRRCIYTRDEVAGLDLAESCVFGGGVPRVAIWGDSHAARIAEPVGDALAARGASLRQLTLSSCLPVPGLINVGQSRAQQCPAFNDMVLAYLDAHPEIDRVILFASWDNYFLHAPRPAMSGADREDDLFARPLGTDASLDDARRRDGVIEALSSLLKKLGGARRIILIESLPRPEVDIPERFATSVWWGHPMPGHAAYDRAIFTRQSGDGRAMVAEAIRRAGLPAGTVRVVDPADALCDAGACDVVRDGRPLYSDTNHPSLEGTALLMPAIVAAVLGD